MILTGRTNAIKTATLIAGMSAPVAMLRKSLLTRPSRAILALGSLVGRFRAMVNCSRRISANNAL